MGRIGDKRLTRKNNTVASIEDLVDSGKPIFSAESISSFLDAVSQAQEVLKTEFENVPLTFFFRGQSNWAWELIPSLFRDKKDLVYPLEKIIDATCPRDKNLYPRELQIIQEVKNHYPMLFDGCKTKLDELTIMQHWGVPTRLIDISANALVALWFASQQHMDVHELGDVTKIPGLNQTYGRGFVKLETESAGKVSVFAVAESQLLNSYGDSDLLTKIADVRLYHCRGSVKSKYSRLKLSADNVVTVGQADFKPHVVTPKFLSEHQRRQEGRFILCPNQLNAKHHIANAPAKIDERCFVDIIIPAASKKNIVVELSNKLGISRHSLFPEVPCDFVPELLSFIRNGVKA